MRRASAKPKPFWLIAWVAGLILVAGLGYWILVRLQDPYRTLQALDVASYLENSDSLRGNVYKVDGTIQSALGWSAESGRLFSVEVSSVKGKDYIPVLIPPELSEVNIQKGQRYSMKLEVRHDGVMKVLEMKKT
jgi:hypothetical protein